MAGKIYVSFIALTGLSGAIGDWISASDVSMITVLLLIVLFYLILGMFLDPIGIILLTLPLTLPIVETYGLSFIWFGNCLRGVCTLRYRRPPATIADGHCCSCGNTHS